MSRKICSKCKKEKDINEFYKCKSHKDGRHSQCKECERPGDLIRHSRNHRSGLSHNDYKRVLEKQNYRCAICGKHISELNKRFKKFDVDHDHKSGKIRGLLCRNCNMAIGLFYENVEFMQRAINYLITNRKKVNN